MFVTDTGGLELADAWIEGDVSARWRSSQVLGASKGAAGLGSSCLEVAPGHRLARHVDSAEEAIVVLAGEAEVAVGSEMARVAAGGVALVPEGIPHEVRNAGDVPLRFLAIYSAPMVTSTYEEPVQPAGERQREGAS